MMISISAPGPVRSPWLASGTRRTAAGRPIGRIAKKVRLFVELLRDPNVPAKPKAWLVGTLILLFNPISQLFSIPVVTFLEDLAVVAFAGRLFLRKVPADVLATHRRAIGI
jgi:hypothetical protein